jgi:hypothetical protein
MCVHILGGIPKYDVRLESYEYCMHSIKADFIAQGYYVRNNQYVSQKLSHVTNILQNPVVMVIFLIS